MDPDVLCPPDAFGRVEEGVFRGAGLQPVNFSFVDTLRLRTLIYLSPDTPHRSVTDFLQRRSVRLLNLGSKMWHSSAGWKPLSDELIKEALEKVLDASNYPLFISCASGVHQTGTVVGCLRRLQQWSLTSIVDEFRQSAGRTKTRYVNEQVIELFDKDLVALPRELPPWFQRHLAYAEGERQELERRAQLTTEEKESLPAFQRFMFSRYPPLVAPGTELSSRLVCEDDED